MATVSFSYYTAYINAVDTQTVTARDSTFVWTPPTFTTYFNTGNPYISSGSRQLERAQFIIPTPTGGTNTTSLSANASAVTAEGSWSGAVSFTLGSKTFTTSKFFNSNNPTVRTLNAKVVIPSYTGLTLNNGTGSNIAHTTSDQTLTNVNITLDAPPTFDNTALTFDTPYVYTGLTNASVTVSNLSAKYGGTITSATLTIGDQTVSRTNNGELSILLNAGGTFTPTVTVTDSRGQTTTKTLDPITVNVYTTPTVAFEAQRTLVTGVPDDEGTYVVISPKFTFIDVIAELEEPTIVATDEGSITYTPTVTWYSTRASDGTLSGSVIWSNLSTGDTVYGLLSLQSGFDILQSYEISVTPIDSEGTGTAKTQMLTPAFFTIDVLAGGHGIAFGKPASNVGFECAMDATFDNPVTFVDDADFGADVFIELPDYQTASTTDKAIYDAIVALGWDSDVLS